MKHESRILTQYFEDHRKQGSVNHLNFKVSFADLMDLDPFGTGKIPGVHVVPRGQDENLKTMIEYCYYDLRVFRFRVVEARPIIDRDRIEELDDYWRN